MKDTEKLLKLMAAIDFKMDYVVNLCCNIKS